MRELLRSAVPSPLTSTPPCSTLTSCIRSTVVWRRPSREAISSLSRPTALTPSVLSKVPSRFWSTARPPSSSVTGGPLVRTAVYRPAGPPAGGGAGGGGGGGGGGAGAAGPPAGPEGVGRARRNPGAREGPRHDDRRAVFRIGEAVAEDHRRPSACRRRTGRLPQRELQV